MPNPILAGFNPDPSVVLAGGMYYLVTSTFEYLPALPVYRSPDLEVWTHIGNVATRPEQVALEHVPTPGGVWAPTIRFRDGIFYVIVTVMLGGRGCVLFTATDPAGPWSDGTPIPAVDGIDPDLAWDEDGVAYVTYARFPDAIRQVRVDLDTGVALEEPRALWAGSGLYAPEGPHLYRRGGYWYLLVAEGGTDRGHAVGVARGPSPEGPWESHPGNPVLSARSTGSAVQNLGHADLVDTADGGTSMVLLGVRPVGLAKAFSPLGRETFLTAVDWADGWPQPRPVTVDPYGAEDSAVDLRRPDALADPGWLAVRRPIAEFASLDASGLAITGAGNDLGHPCPAFVGRRQRHLHAVVSTTVDASCGVGGLMSRYSEDHVIALEARTADSGTTVTARAILAGLETSWRCTVAAVEVELRLEMTPPPSHFSAGAVGGDRIRLVVAADGRDTELAELDGRYWTFEVAKSFTGRVVGMYAVEGTVRFAAFSYRGSDAP